MNTMLRGAVLAACACLLAAPVVHAQAYMSDFEGLVALPFGFPLTGQDGYYLPNATSVDYFADVYVANGPGMSENPNGNLVFVWGTGPADGNFARAQRDFDVPLPAGLWTAAYDLACVYTGSLPSAQNIGSFSVNSGPDLVPNDFIHLYTWVDPNTASEFAAGYLAYDAAGVQFAQPGEFPGPEWSSLEADHWYRFWTTFDTANNTIVEVGLIDITTGVETVANPVGWFMEGGAAGSTAPSINFRFFSGSGTAAGNTCGWDNINIEPAAATAVEPATWGSIKASFK